MKKLYQGLVSVLALLPVAAQAADFNLEEIVVTAQKREQRLIDVPMSVAAVSGAELLQRGVTNVQDLSFAVPGLTMREDGPGSYTIFMRGLANASGSEALVGVYMDDAPLSLDGFNQLDFRPFDLERVEVLKGPQGTLYGQGALAGAIRYITRRADPTRFEGRVEAEGYLVEEGEWGQKINAMVNAPIVEDKLAIRIAGGIENGGGWIDQPEAGVKDGNGQDVQWVRGKILWNITDRFQAEGTIQIFRSNTFLGLGYEQPDRTNFIPEQLDASRLTVPKDFEYDLYNLNLTYDLGFAQLLSSTTYIDHRHQYPFTYIGGMETFYQGGAASVDARHVDANQFSQEVRLTSTGESRFHWTVGGFYRDYENNFYSIYDVYYVDVGGPVILRDLLYIDDNTSESFSLFADVSYDITDRLTVGAGVRYFEDKKTNWDGFLFEKDKFDSIDPRFYISYAVTENANIYGSIAKGFRSGGLNRGALPNYDPEEVYSYEVGAKGSLIPRVLDFEVAAYYTEYKDMFRRNLEIIDGTAQSLVTNTGKVEVKGIEAGVTWYATPALALNATGAWIDSEVVKVLATDAVNLPGDPTDYVPEFSFTLGANYDFTWKPDVPGFIRIDYSYRDRVSYIDRSSFPAEFLPQWSDKLSLVNARIGAQWNNVNVEAYVLNLTDENKSIDPYQAWENANRTRPRTFGLKVGFDF